MNTFEEIKLLIEEDVRCDIHGDLYGHERVAEYLAERIDAYDGERTVRASVSGYLATKYLEDQLETA